MQIVKVLAAAVLLLYLPVTFAQAVSSKGTARITYQKKLSPEVEAEAFRQAQVNALDRYYSDEDQAAKAENYAIVRDRIVADIGKYVLDVLVLDKTVDDKAKTYSIVIRANLNGANLSVALKSGSAVANATAAEKSSLTFIFMAREQVSIKSFDAKVTKRTDQETTQTGVEASHGAATDSEAVSSMESAHGKSSIETTGGSKTRKADEVRWKVSGSTEIDSAMEQIFTRAGYQVEVAAFVAADSGGLFTVEAVRKDYASGNDLSEATLISSVRGVRAAGVRYLALATLDVGLRGTDASTGLVSVVVTVNAKVLDVSRGRPVVVAAVGPDQARGLGEDEMIARTSALKTAAKSAGEKLMNALNAANVQ